MYINKKNKHGLGYLRLSCKCRIARCRISYLWICCSCRRRIWQCRRSVLRFASFYTWTGCRRTIRLLMWTAVCPVRASDQRYCYALMFCVYTAMHSNYLQSSDKNSNNRSCLLINSCNERSNENKDYLWTRLMEWRYFNMLESVYKKVDRCI